MDEETKDKLFGHLANWLNGHMSGSRKAIYGKEESKETKISFNVGTLIVGGGFAPLMREDVITIALMKNPIGYINIANKETGLFFNVEHAEKTEFNEEVSVADPESYEKVLKIIESWPITNYKFGFTKWT